VIGLRMLECGRNVLRALRDLPLPTARAVQNQNPRRNRHFPLIIARAISVNDSEHLVSCSSSDNSEHSDVSFGRLFGSCDSFGQNAVFSIADGFTCYAVNVN